MVRRKTSKSARKGQIDLSYKKITPNFLRNHLGAIPQKMHVTLPWLVSSGLSTTTAQTYTEAAVTILNGAYDPDSALGGTQPFGFAKMMQFYSKCFVLGARIKIKGSLSGVGFEGPPTGAMVLGLVITTNTTALSGIDLAMGAGLSEHQIVNINPDRFAFDLSVDIAKFVDKPNLLDDPQWFNTVSANPSQVIVAHFWYYTNSVLTTTSISFTLEVEMDCVFTDPIPFV
jgi:hypothetical protein